MPNPFTSSFKIQIEEGDRLEEIVIFDLTGQMVSRIKNDLPTSSYTVPVQNLHDGIYIIKAVTQNSVKVLTGIKTTEQ